MHHRLLSFLTDFERSLAADDPAPDGGTWETSRMVNYHLGLARLDLQVRVGELPSSRGQVLVQGYQLADGTPCLKATLSWTGTERTTEHAIYAKPEVNWTSEARKIAAQWMAGAPAPRPEEEPAATPERLEAAV
ncbi:MAG: hypothetical protein NDI75_00765 [Candidatus Didemnitutus sp.]|nr:hypothetical protein [Candidatus Didemnitutus sp.]